MENTMIGTLTTHFNSWTTPKRIDVIENNDNIEIIYKETSLIQTMQYPTPPPQERVFKIIFSCIDGKWNKSDRIYGKIIRATSEQYIFNE